MQRAIFYPLLASFVASGCASMESHVVARASRDFSCAREQTVITDQFGGVYRLEGCGFVATYQCEESRQLRVSCQAIATTQIATRATTAD